MLKLMLECMLLISVSLSCPLDHPFSYGRGKYCCQHMYKLNNSSVSPECNGAKSNPYSDIRCCPNADFVDCSMGNTCKTFKIGMHITFTACECKYNCKVYYYSSSDKLPI